MQLVPRRTRGRPLSVGLNIPYVEGSLDGLTPRWADIRAMALTAEAIGFDAVWISDHLGFGDPAGEWTGAWESWTLLSALGAVTERVHLGPYVAAVPYRNPALLAKMAETLDEVTGGRAILAIGAGWNEAEFRAYGFPWERRFDRFEDALQIMRSMLRTGTATHDGRMVRADHAQLAPRGPRPGGLPIVVGANGPRMLRLTAELADDWNVGLRSADEAARLMAGIEEACQAVGRDPGTLSRSVEALVRTIGADGEPGGGREIGGSPEVIAAELRRFADAGYGHLQIQLRPNRLDAVEAFAPVMEALDAA